MDNDDAKQYVWYVSYGSNLNRERFLIYIQGGAAKGAKKAQPGSRDQSLPVDDRAIEIEHSLYFSGRSMIYDGGVGFIGAATPNTRTKVRAYLITEGQFWDVIKQENEWPTHPPTRNIDIIREQGEVLLEDMGGAYTQYNRVLYLGEMDGWPMLTMTSPQQHTKAQKPSAMYLKTIHKGLNESHKLTTEQTADYFSALFGIANHYTKAELIDLLMEAY